MMSLEYIREINRVQTNKARRHARKPWLPTPEQRKKLAEGASLDSVGARLPHIGDYVPKGWVQWHEILFVDSSGCGAPGEPALTQSQLAKEIAKDRDGVAYAVIEAGQFQCYVARYSEKPKQRRAA
jgi:hypothetical protein